MKRVLFSAIIIILVVLGAGLFLSTKHKQEATGLKNFYKLTENDPLFYSSFFDSKEWEKSIKVLKDSEDGFKKASIENYPKAFPSASYAEKNDYALGLKENDLAPYQFLQDLVLINQKTNDFLKNPSPKLGKELLNLYNNATDSYIKDAETKITALEKIDKKKNIMNKYVVFIDSASSYKVVKNDFLTIKENGYKLKQEIAQRKKCLSGKTSCPEPLQNTKKINDFIDSLNAKFDLKGERIDGIKKIITSINYPSSLKLSGPYRIHSVCLQSPDYQQWMYLLLYNDVYGRPSLVPKLATQSYFQKIPKEDNGKKILKALLKNGFDFQFQLESATYRCLDLAFYSELATLDFVKKQIDNGKIVQEDLTKNRDYKLLIENQFGLMVRILNRITVNNYSLKTHVLVEKNPPPEEYLLMVRSNYSIFSFPFAKSIWRIDKKLKYVLSQQESPALSSPEFFTIDDLKKLGYNEDEIRKFFIEDLDTFIESLLNN